MEQNFSSTKLPTVGASSAIGGAPAWSNPTRITADDGSSASWAASAGGQMSSITGSVFGFQQLPDSAVIDGLAVTIDGTQFSVSGNVSLNISGHTPKPIGSLNGSYGGPTDLWGKDSISTAEIAALTVTASADDISGGDGTASIDYMSVTVYWHIEVSSTPADVPTRFAYKVYSREGNYLGELPKVSSKFVVVQDINSAGSLISIVCAQFVKNEVTVSPLLTEDGDPITTEDDEIITTTQVNLLITTGDAVEEAIYKNSNKVKVWMYNKYYPNGKLMFSGSINKIDFKYGASDPTVKLTVYSDGMDLGNYIARGYPFIYDTEIEQLNYNAGTYYNIYQGSPLGPGEYDRYGQSFTTTATQTNIGAISSLFQGNADLTITLFDAPNGNVIASATKRIDNASWAESQVEFPQLVTVTPNTEYFYAYSVGENQVLSIRLNPNNDYAAGNWWYTYFRSPAAGGIYLPTASEHYFRIKSGTPTTTTTYSTDDPVTEMASGILLDYNGRGGLITEGDFVATGLSLTYTFVVATVLDALNKILEMSPDGYYYYVDLGQSEIDIKPVSATADFTITRGRHINELALILSIEQVKNYLLFSGGDVGGGVNLYQDYSDSESVNNYGIRTVARSDNRVTLAATADAIGDSFVEENSDEVQETQVTVKGDHIDLTLLTPGKTIGFRNFGNFIDDMVLRIVRRESNFTDDIAVLTLGRLPVRTNDEIQRISRDMLNQQTINNPSAPS